MFKQLEASDNVIALKVSGKVTADDIKGYAEILKGQLKDKDKVNVYCDYTGLSDMTADALVAGAKADLTFFSHIKKLNRLAMVSEKEWMKAVMDYIKPLLPTIEIKIFPPEKSGEAMEWASQMPKETKQAQGPAISFIPTNRADAIAFEMDGIISSEEMPGVTEKFNEFLEEHDKVRLLAKIKHYGFEPAVLTQKGLFSMKLTAMRKVARYAIVGGPTWMVKVVEAMSGIFDGMEIRTFKAEDEADAWAWLEAKPAE